MTSPTSPKSEGRDGLRDRFAPEGDVPLLAIEGTPYEAGQQLGAAWHQPLLDLARHSHEPPWWRTYRKLVERYAPHLPDLYRGMAAATGLPEEKVGNCLPQPVGGCTSFALHPSVTMDGIPIAGQSKDTSLDRCYRYQILRLRLHGAPAALTATYPGWLFGHGFVAGGCAIFRNSIFAPEPAAGLPYHVWGLLALHCHTTEEVRQLTHDHGVGQTFHCTVQDSVGDILGMESSRAGTDFLTAEKGIYVHANAVRRNIDMQAEETGHPHFSVPNSAWREARLRELLLAEPTPLTAQQVYRALGDHANFPASLCRHFAKEAATSAVIIVEPTRGRLTISRGPSCQNWPHTYQTQAGT